MAALSNYLENNVLDHTLGTASFTSPSTVYVALFTTDPTDADTGDEVSGGGYDRQAVTFNAASGGSTSNDEEVVFDVASASWGTITHIGIYDAATDGNLLYHGELNDSKAIDSSDQFRIPADNLTITID